MVSSFSTLMCTFPTSWMLNGADLSDRAIDINFGLPRIAYKDICFGSNLPRVIQTRKLDHQLFFGPLAEEMKRRSLSSL